MFQACIQKQLPEFIDPNLVFKVNKALVVGYSKPKSFSWKIIFTWQPVFGVTYAALLAFVFTYHVDVKTQSLQVAQNTQISQQNSTYFA